MEMKKSSYALKLGNVIGGQFNSGSVVYLNASGLGTVNPNYLYVNPANGNVGIGTTPGVKLQINGVAATGHAFLKLVQTDDNGYPVLELTRNKSGGSYNGIWQFYMPANTKDFSFYSSTATTSQPIYISGTTGNVGIGTMSPTAKLSVSGSVSDKLLDIQSGAGTPVIFASGSGFVGIGTTSPIGILDVAERTGNARVFVRDSRAGGEFFRMSAGTDSGGLAISDSATSLILGTVPIGSPDASLTALVTILTGSGNVGIGAAVPNSLIDVSGSVAFSSTFSPSSNFTLGAGYYYGCTAGNITGSLPTSVGVRGRMYVIKDQTGAASSSTILIAASGSQTIDGVASKTINTDYGVLRVIANGGNWFTM